MGNEIISTLEAQSMVMADSSYVIVSHHGQEVPEAYRNLIYAKWMRSLRYGNDFFKLVDPEAFYDSYQQYIATILNMPRTVVRLALLSDNRDVVLGFSVHRGPILDYVHVHRSLRMMKIGTSLLPQNVDTITHLTRTALSIWGSKYKHWKFNPFA